MKLFDFNKTVPYIKKKGVSRFFQIIYHNFFDLVLLNFIFAVTCVPVFTIGAAYKALICVCSKYVEDKGVSAAREYFGAFGSEFLKSTLYTALFSLLFTIIAFASVFYYNLAKQNVIFYFASAVSLTCLIVLFMMTCWFFPLYVKTRQSFKALFVNSFVLAFANLKRSLLFLLTAFVCTFSVFAFLPYSLPVVFVFPFSFTAVASAFAANDKIIEIFKVNKPSQEG